MALANSARTSGTVGAADTALYSIAGTSTTPPNITAAYFNNITTGTNGSGPEHSAMPGYNFVTGLGSPVAQDLVPALAASSADFAAMLTPALQTLGPGEATSYTVTVTPSSTYDGTVNLSVSALPSGASGTFNPPSLVGSGTSTLTVQTSASTPVGTNVFTITGADASGSPTHSVNATLGVENTMTVSAISYSTSGFRGRTLNITLTVVNDQGQAVPNASVSVNLDFDGSLYSSGTASTGSNGEVTFTVQYAPTGTYSTAVTSVTASGLTWDGKYPANSYTN
jgi:hypothetical protein